MAAKPPITLIGAGNLARALAPQLAKAGYRIEAIISRDTPPSLRRARRLAKLVRARTTTTSAGLQSSIFWFCVPDSEIASAAHFLLATQASASHKGWRGKIAFHSSGALTSDELTELRQAGASVASLHPLMTFVQKSQPAMAGVAFAIEGDPAATRIAKKIVDNLEGRAFSIRKQEKAAYHACGTFASPFLTALLAVTEEVAQAAGMTRKSARQRLLPILQQTVSNYARLGGPASFSGPLVRGDVETVKKHLEQLRNLPVAREIYLALARSSLQLLPVKNRAALKAALNGMTI